MLVLGAGAGAVSWLCAWWGQVDGAGAGAAGAGAGPVSWLRVRWRQVAGAGAGCRRWCCELAVHVVETGCLWCRMGAGARCWRWLCAYSTLYCV